MKDSTLCTDKTKKDSTAIITDIQRYSLHDGPGIRTVVFFKGCPLSCQWCQNPEATRPEPEMFCIQALCIGCGACIEACQHHYKSVIEGRIVTFDECTMCGACTMQCPTKACKIVGKAYTIDGLMDVLIRDVEFYRNSSGGVTLSGGEVTFQHRFAADLLDELRKARIHSAIETCGYAPQENFKKIACRLDLLLFDIKHLDSKKHIFFTGVDNGLILSNLDMVLEMGKEVIIRFPLIPGVNDDDETLAKVAALCLSRKIDSIHMLPFHQGGRSKWHSLNREYVFDGYNSVNADKAESAKSFLESRGISVNIGGNC